MCTSEIFWRSYNNTLKKIDRLLIKTINKTEQLTEPMRVMGLTCLVNFSCLIDLTCLIDVTCLID